MQTSVGRELTGDGSERPVCSQARAVESLESSNLVSRCISALGGIRSYQVLFSEGIIKGKTQIRHCFIEF